jgi:hypothetical protein
MKRCLPLLVAVMSALPVTKALADDNKSKKVRVEEVAKSNQFTFAYWEPDGLWYPATIEKEDGDRVFVKYHDGDSKWTDSARVGRYTVEAGDRVYGNWLNKGLYYAGKITRIEGDAIRIRYDDGDVEDTTIAAIRMNLDSPRMWQVGTRVMARWKADGFWYPAAIIDTKDGLWQVRYTDGVKEWLEAREIFKYAVTPGDRVEGNWLGGGLYYRGTVTSRKGKNIHISYDDGDQEDTTTDMVRMALQKK